MISFQSEYKVSPNSLKFLAGVGFDFHKQLMHGIPYEPGPDKVPQRFDGALVAKNM
jgi:hypothetical protein